MCCFSANSIRKWMVMIHKSWRASTKSCWCKSMAQLKKNILFPELFVFFGMRWQEPKIYVLILGNMFNQHNYKQLPYRILVYLNWWVCVHILIIGLNVFVHMLVWFDERHCDRFVHFLLHLFNSCSHHDVACFSFVLPANRPECTAQCTLHI